MSGGTLDTLQVSDRSIWYYNRQKCKQTGEVKILTLDYIGITKSMLDDCTYKYIRQFLWTQMTKFLFINHKDYCLESPILFFFLYEK